MEDLSKSSQPEHSEDLFDGDGDETEDLADYDAEETNAKVVQE